MDGKGTSAFLHRIPNRMSGIYFTSVECPTLVPLCERPRIIEPDLDTASLPSEVSSSKWGRGTGGSACRRCSLLSSLELSHGTTEFAVVGLLPDIAESLGVSISQTGSLVSVYALGVAVGGPAVVAITTSQSRKRTLLQLCAIFVVGHALAALAPHYGLLMGARVLRLFRTPPFSGLLRSSRRRAWQARYFKKQYARIDPVIARGNEAVLPFDWDELPKDDPAFEHFLTMRLIMMLAAMGCRSRFETARESVRWFPSRATIRKPTGPSINREIW